MHSQHQRLIAEDAPSIQHQLGHRCPQPAAKAEETSIISTETNKQAILAFADAYTRADWDAVETLLTEDFRWVVPTARARQSPMLKQQVRWMAAAERSRDETIQLFKYVQGICVGGKFSIEILSMTAEEDRVAAEARSHAVSMATGRVYDNQYVYIMYFRDRRISLFREYQDTLHAFDVWLAE